jgi:hypothetical protein
VTPVIRDETMVYQTSYTFLCELLRGILADGAQAGPDAEKGLGSSQCRLSGALYDLLMAHPLDQRGRCRCCRRPGAVLGQRRQRCWVHLTVHCWLRQPEWLLHDRVIHEWGLGHPSPPSARAARQHAACPADPDDTGVVPPIARKSGESTPQPHQTPAAPSPLSPPETRGAGRPDPTHGGAGEDTEHLATDQTRTARHTRTTQSESLPLPEGRPPDLAPEPAVPDPVHHRRPR